jgi:hypothetical protein
VVTAPLDTLHEGNSIRMSANPVHFEARRFRLSDVLVLVVCSAISFELMRATSQYDSMIEIKGGRAGLSPMFSTLVSIHWFLAHALLGLGLFQLAVRFLRPRPSIRRAMRQPGFIAPAAMAIACILRMMFHSWTLVVYARRYPGDPAIIRWGGLIFSDNSETVVPAIAVAWLTLLACGRWRPATDWVDLLGRWVGWGWFATAPIYIASRCLL